MKLELKIKILVIILIIIFTLFYIMQLSEVNANKKDIKENFEQYDIKSSDIVSLYGLDNIVVGNDMPIPLPSAINKLIDDRNKSTINNTFAKNSDLININQNISSNASIISGTLNQLTDINNRLNNDLNNINNSLTSNVDVMTNRLNTTRTQLINTINNLIPILNTNVSTSINNSITSINQNLNNMVKLIGVMNYTLHKDLTGANPLYGRVNNSSGTSAILGFTDNNSNEKRIVPVSQFNDSIRSLGLDFGIATGINIPGGGNEVCCICLFDWIIDKNIIFNNNDTSKKFYHLTHTFPSVLGNDGLPKSPFNSSNFEKNTKYFTKVQWSNFHSYTLGLFYILYNANGRIIKFVNKIVTNKPEYHTQYNLEFTFETQNDTIDVGFYILPIIIGNMSTGRWDDYKLTMDANNQASISIFKLSDNNTIPQINNITTPTINI